MKKFLMVCLTLFCFALPFMLAPSMGHSNLYAAEDSVFSADTTETIKDDLTSAQDINYTRNALMVSDFDTKTIFNINKPEESHTVLFQPTALAADFQDNLYYAVEGYGITKLDSNNVLTPYNEYSADPGVANVSIGEVYDLACSIDGTVWAIARGYGDLKVLIYKPFDSELFLLFQSLDTLDLGSGSKIAISLDAEIIIIATASGLFQIEDGNIISLADNPESFEYTLPAGLTNIKNIAIDHSNDLLVLEQSTPYKLIRAKKNTFLTFEDTSNLLDGIGAFALDDISGEIYFNTATEVKKITISDQYGNPFLNTLTHDDEPDYVKELPTEVVSVARVTADSTYVYEFDTLLHMLERDGVRLTLNTDCYAIVLDSCPDSDFCFVLLTSFAEGDITGYLMKEEVEILAPETVNYTARLIVPNTEIFGYPTSLDADLILEPLSPPFQVVAEFSFADYNNISFVAIRLGEGSFGYVNSNCILDTSTPVIEQTIVTNARTRSEVIVYADEFCTVPLITLPAGTNVQITERQDGVAQILWGLGISFGYLAVSELDDGSLSQAQLIGLILMAGCVLIAIALITVTAVKNKKDKKIV